MIKYTLIVSYDGTAYCGWQQQEKEVTVAGVICSRFKKVFGRDCSIIAASRTDAGVHALGQVARITTDLVIDPSLLCRVLNGALPPDIHVRSAQLRGDDFHPLYHVEYKMYYYHIFTKRPLPQWARYGYYCSRKLDLKKFEEALQIFVGTHDFRSFATGELTRSTIKTIASITLTFDRRMHAYRVTFKGAGFLRHMIRRIVGAALHVSCADHLPIESLQKALLEKNPSQQLPTAPAHGLLLRKVVYKNS